MDESASSDDGDDSLLSPGKNREPTSLRLNDEIEFYSHMAIHGDPQQLRSDTVVGIIPDNLEYPLLLSKTMMLLPATHQVRQLPNGYWQPINRYLLEKEGIQSMADIGSGFNNNVKQMRDIRTAIAQATDDYWKKDDYEDNGDSKQKAKPTRQTRVSRSSSRLQRKIDDTNDEVYVDSIFSNSSDNDVEVDTSDSDCEGVLY